MFILLMLLTALVVLIFFGTLAVYLFYIVKALDAIGGSPDSFLAKLRLGLRAIETETSHLPTQVIHLNQGLSAVRDGLKQVDVHLVNTIEAVVKQEDYP